MLDRKELELKLIRLDGGTQVRAAIKEEAVMRYATDLEGGSVFPPMRVFFDGTDYWMSDGFHRYHAAPPGMPCSLVVVQTICTASQWTTPTSARSL